MQPEHSARNRFARSGMTAPKVANESGEKLMLAATFTVSKHHTSECSTLKELFVVHALQVLHCFDNRKYTARKYVPVQRESRPFGPMALQASFPPLTRSAIAARVSSRGPSYLRRTS